MRILLAVALLLWGFVAQAQPIGPSNNSTGGSVTPSGTFTSGDLVCGAGGTSIQDCSALSTAATVPKGLQFTNSIVYSGAYSIAQQWFTIDGKSLTGTATTPVGANKAIAPVNIYIGNDTVDTTTSGNGGLSIFNVTHATAAGSTGGRIVINASENIVGTPTTLTAGGYVAISGITRISATLGGATGVYANYKGTTFGSNFNIFTTPGTTFLSLLTAQENDVTLASGSSAAEKHALTIVQGANDAVRAVYDDSAIQFNAQDGTTTTWTTGIMFGAYAHKWSFAADSTLIGAQIRQTGPASSSIALNGVDFSSVTFQSTGCAFKSTGFCVDGPTGDVLLSPAGSTSNPTLAFLNCGTNCGWYAPTSNQIGLVINGARVLDNGITRAGWTVSGQFVNDTQIIITANTGSFQTRSGNTVWSSPANGSWQSGAVDAAVAVAQTLRAQSVVAGTSNVAGANWTVIGSLSTGSGVSGDIIVQTGGTGAGATVQNSPVTALTIKGATQQVIFAGQINVAAMTQTAAAQSGTVCYNSGTGVITYDATLGCLASTLNVKDRWQDIDPDQALALVIRMRPGSFSYKPDLGLPTGEQIGFAAEQIAEVDDRLVGRRPDGSLAGVRYQQSSALYAAAIQALKSQLETLKRRVH